MNHHNFSDRAVRQTLPADPDTKQALNNLEKQIRQKQAEGDMPQVFIARQARAMLYLINQRWSAAAREYQKAAKIARAEEQPFLEAECYLGQGMALENLPQAHQKTVDAYRQAAAIYGRLRVPVKLLESRQRLATYYVSCREHEAAIAEMSAAITELETVAQPGLVLQAYRQRAMLRLSSAKFTASSSGAAAQVAAEELALALADFDRAQQLAEAGGEENVALAIRVQRRGAQQLFNSDAPLEDAPTLQRLSLDAGSLDTLGDIYLQQAKDALARQDYAEMLAAADNARRAALQATDTARYIRYLVACLFMANAREALNDRPGVIAILLTCKKSLEQALGKEVGDQMKLLLDSLAVRWGPAELNEAVQLYRQRMASA
ncbi:MAG: hypothetical protein Kow0031_29390 [Anaerolineae bacterium]